MGTFLTGQAVTVAATHNHLPACALTTYHIGDINRVQGQYMVNLLHNGKSVGAIPESKLKLKA